MSTIVSEEEFKKSYKELLSPTEMQQVYNALEVLNLSFTQFYNLSFSLVDEVQSSNSKLTSAHLVNADLTTLINKKLTTATIQEKEIIEKLNLLSLKLPYLRIEKYIAEGHYELAFQHAKDNLQLLNGLIVHGFPIPVPPLVLELKDLYEKVINKSEEEERQFLQKTFSWNQYDLNLLQAYKQMREIERNEKIIDLHPGSKGRILQLYEDLIRSYCTYNNLNFDLHLRHDRPIIVPADGYNYAYYLAMLLVGFDNNRITALLDWQLQQYAGEEMFPSMVESLTYGNVDRLSPFDNNHRLKTIMDWVQANRQFVRSGKAYYKTPEEKTAEDSTKLSGPKIEWKELENFLIMLSRELFGEGFIQHENSFVTVIKRQRKIKWLGDPVPLAYLLYKLEKLGKIKSPHRGHFKAAEELFIYDLDNKVVKKTNAAYLRKLSSEIVGRNANSFKQRIQKIDSILNRVFPSKES